MTDETQARTIPPLRFWIPAFGVAFPFLVMASAVFFQRQLELMVQLSIPFLVLAQVHWVAQQLYRNNQ